MKKNVISLAKNFCGSRGFQNYFNEDEDILKNGDLSCAVFISTVLSICRLIDGISFTVTGLLNRMNKSNFFEIEDPKPGCIVLWDPVEQDGNSHYHIGIYIGDGVCVSNRSSTKMPGEHPLIYTGLDKDVAKKVVVSKYFWHQQLG